MPTIQEVSSPEFGGWIVRLKADDLTVEYDSVAHLPTKSGSTLDAVITFRLPFSVTGEINSMQLMVRNVHNTAIERFKRGMELQFEAGWIPQTEDNTLALELVVEDLESISLGNSYSHLKILASTESRPLMETPVSMDWPPGTKVSTVFADIAQEIELEVNLNKPKRDYSYPTGFCHWGTAWSAFNLLAADSFSKFYPWHKELFLTPSDDGGLRAPKLSPQKGLLKTQRLQKQDLEQLSSLGKEEDDLKIYRVRVLLTPHVFPDAKIKIEEAEDMDPHDQDVRVLWGYFENNTRSHVVVADVIPLAAEESNWVLEQLQKVGRDLQTLGEAFGLA